MTAQRTAGRNARMRPWAAVMASLGAMALVFTGLMAAQLSGFASDSAPLVVVAGSGTSSTEQVVQLTQDQVAHDSTDSVTVRLRNDSAAAVAVTAALQGGSPNFSGTLTAALTEDGASVRSGALSSLALGPFTLASHSTTPVTLELDTTTTNLAGMWAASPHLALQVHTR